jgi:ATP synthase protein I
MSQPSPLVDRTLALRLLFWQLMAGLCLTGAGLWQAPLTGVSAATGAGIAIAGNAYFILRAFWGAGSSPQEMLKGFYRGEAGKFIITVLLFAAVFARFKTVQVPWLFTGFILELLLAWIVPLVATLRDRR